MAATSAPRRDSAAASTGALSQQAPPVPSYQSLFYELGRSGLKRFGGSVNEEFLTELRGKRGVQKFKEMRENHPVINAIFFAIEMSLRQVKWHFEPASSNPYDVEAAEFCDQCLADMSFTWNDTLAQILTMLQYGYSVFELIYKVRRGREKPWGADPNADFAESDFKDGRVGWRKWMAISQDTLTPGNEWIFDDAGGVQGISQLDPATSKSYKIHVEKLLLYRTTVAKNNPEGRSLLRGMYLPWYFSKNFAELEGISYERMGTGLPVVYLGNDTNKADTATSDLALAKQIVRDVRLDEMSGVVIPYPKMGAGAREGEGVLFELVTPPGRSMADFDRVINRYDKRLALAGLAQFVMLGQEQVGSFALSKDQSDIFVMALGAWAESIAQVINRYALPRLFKLNPSFEVNQLPKLAHSEIAVPDLAQLASYINALVGSQVLTPDANLEKYLRDAAHLPPKMEAITVAPQDANAALDDLLGTLGVGGDGADGTDSILDDLIARARGGGPDAQAALTELQMMADRVRAERLKADRFYDPSQARDEQGQWTDGGGLSHQAILNNLPKRKMNSDDVLHHVSDSPGYDLNHQMAARGILHARVTGRVTGEVERKLRAHSKEDTTKLINDMANKDVSMNDAGRYLNERYSVHQPQLPIDKHTASVITSFRDDGDAEEQRETYGALGIWNASDESRRVSQFDSDTLQSYKDKFQSTLADSRTARGGARYETATNEYQAELENIYTDWYDALAKKLAAEQDAENRERLLLLALIALEGDLKRAGREGILRAMQIGAGAVPLTGRGLASLAQAVSENDAYIEGSLIPAIRAKAQAGLNDPMVVAGGITALAGIFSVFISRVASYSGIFWTAIFMGVGDALMQDPNFDSIKVERVLDPGAQHCSTCPGKAGVYDNFQIMRDTVGIPADGSDRCFASCRCVLKTETSPGSGVFQRF